MSPWLPIGWSLVVGATLWLASGRVLERAPQHGRSLLAGASVGGMLVLLALAVAVALDPPSSSVRWGAGLTSSLAAEPPVGVIAVLVPAIGGAVLAWAAAHEDEDGLPRLLGLLVLFIGAMELLVLAADLLTLAAAWELVSAASWALIAHRWREPEPPRAATHAFVVTRIGGLGLWCAIGAALATGSGLELDALGPVATSAWGDLLAGGVLLAATTKAAQVPFAPWLFRAMEGPTAASALLHSSTLVAAGVWLVIRLHEPLAAVSWFGPAALAIGLTTAIAGGLVAANQTDAKRLLAASTSAQHGLMLTAAGAGFPGVALLHLVAHAALKALLFLVAGEAIHATGTRQLTAMRAGRHLPAVAVASAVGALALAAIPPLGAAWTKDQIVAAAGTRTPWLGAATLGAGALSAWYAARFQILAFGRGPTMPPPVRSGATRLLPIGFLATLTIVLGALWLPAAHALATQLVPGRLPPETTRGQTLSILTAGLAAAASVAAHRRARREHARPRWRRILAGWIGLPDLIQVGVTAPITSLSGLLARFEARASRRVSRGIAGAAHRVALLLRGATERALRGSLRLGIQGVHMAACQAGRADERTVAAATRGLAARVGSVGSASRLLQRGKLARYYALVAAGALVLWLALALESS